MDGDAPLTRLPAVYAVALALRDLGLAPEQIAQRLQLTPEAMPSLLAIAEAKLAAMSAAPHRTPNPDRDSSR